MVEAAQQLFHGIVERYETIAAAYAKLQSRWLSVEEFEKYVVDVIAPDPRNSKEFNPESKLAHLVLQRADTKRTELERLWYAGQGHTGEPTAWFTYNATVEALDHNAGLWPNRNGSWRTASLLSGQYGDWKHQVLRNMLMLSEVAA